MKLKCPNCQSFITGKIIKTPMIIPRYVNEFGMRVPPEDTGDLECILVCKRCGGTTYYEPNAEKAERIQRRMSEPILF